MITGNTEINNLYKVSQKTANFLECYKLGDQLWGQFADAMEALWGAERVDEMMDDFADKYKALFEVVEKNLTDCIFENFASLGKNGEYRNIV